MEAACYSVKYLTLSRYSTYVSYHDGSAFFVIYSYIMYIYTYMCVCVCIQVYLFSLPFIFL